MRLSFPIPPCFQSLPVHHLLESLILSPWVGFLFSCLWFCAPLLCITLPARVQMKPNVGEGGREQAGNAYPLRDTSGPACCE